MKQILLSFVILIWFFSGCSMAQRPMRVTMRYTYDSTAPDTILGHKILLTLINDSEVGYYMPYLKPWSRWIKFYELDTISGNYIFNEYLEQLSLTKFADNIPEYHSLKRGQDRQPSQFVYEYNWEQDSIIEVNGNTSQQSFLQTIFTNTDTSMLDAGYKVYIANYLTNVVYIAPHDSINFSHMIYSLWHRNPIPGYVYNNTYKVVFEYDSSNRSAQPRMNEDVPSIWNGYQRFQGVIQSDTMMIEIINNQLQWHIIE